MCIHNTYKFSIKKKEKIKNIQARVRSSQNSKFRRSDFRGCELGGAAQFWSVTADSLTPARCLCCVFPRQGVKEVSPGRLCAAGRVQESFVQGLRGCTDPSMACWRRLSLARASPAPRSPGAPACLCSRCNQSVFSSRLVTYPWEAGWPFFTL